MSNEARNIRGDRMVSVFMPEPFERAVVEMLDGVVHESIASDVAIFVLQEMLDGALRGPTDHGPISFEESVLRGLGVYRDAARALMASPCECPECMAARRKLH